MENGRGIGAGEEDFEERKGRVEGMLGDLRWSQLGRPRPWE